VCIQANNTTSVQSTYDAENGSQDFGAGEMERDQEAVEPSDSLAEQRVPAIYAFRKPSDVPKDSDAWREMVLEDEERIVNETAQRKAKAKLAKLQGSGHSKAARAAMRKQKAALERLQAEQQRRMGKLRHRALIVHRQNVHEAGQAKLADADEATLLRQTHFEEYAPMSEGEAVALLLDRCNAIDERNAKRAECNAARATRKAGAPAESRLAAHRTAETSAAAQAARNARRETWRRRRDEMLGLVELEPVAEAAVAEATLAEVRVAEMCVDDGCHDEAVVEEDWLL
jgi:hypothetical protein